MRRAEEQFGGGPLLQVLVEWPAEGKLRSRETLAVLAEAHDAIEASPAASAPVSVLSVLHSLPGPDDPLERFGELRYVPSKNLRTLVREDERLALVATYAPDAGAAALRGPLDELDAQLRMIEQHHPGYQLHLTGLAVVSTYRTTSMIMNLLTGPTLELVIIFVIISLALRSPLLGLVSLPSNVFPMVAMAAAVVLIGWPLRYATVLAFNICLGIAVDDTIHFLSRYRRELAAVGDRREAIRRSFAAVAPVMVTTTILMLTGFGAALFCTIPTIRAFGTCSCLALVLALASEAVILPTLLLCWASVAERFAPNSATVKAPAPNVAAPAEEPA
jgi:predicted RND superfamily exporter protein